MDADSGTEIAGPPRTGGADRAELATAIWRTRPADAIGVADLRAMKNATVVAASAGDAAWRRAAAGDAAAAVGVALGIFRAHRLGASFDAAMTTVAVCALQGDAAACLVTSHMLRRLPHAGRREARFATSWLLRAFDRLLTDRNAVGSGS